MRSVLFRIPLPFTGYGIPIYAYGLMVMIGFITAIYAARWRARQVGIASEAILDMGLIAVCAGILGARLFHVIENAADYFRGDESPVLKILAINRGGLVWYGGFLAAAAAIFIFLRRKKLPFLRTLDIIAPSVVLGLGFGRIGCFLNGCCYGKPTSLPWGVVFPAGALPYHGDPAKPWTYFAEGTRLHPTQLYMSLSAFALFGILSYIFAHRRREGEVTFWLLFLYPIARFLNEMLRGDTRPDPRLGGLSISQKVSILVFCGAILYGIWVWLCAPRTAAPAKTTSETTRQNLSRGPDRTRRHHQDES